MSGGERPIGAAKGKRPNTEALCQPPRSASFFRPLSLVPPFLPSLSPSPSLSALVPQCLSPLSLKPRPGRRCFPWLSVAVWCHVHQSIPVCPQGLRQRQEHVDNQLEEMNGKMYDINDKVCAD